MKNNLLYFALGLMFTICVASTSQAVHYLCKPMVPKSIIVQDFRSMYGLEKDMREFIIENAKKGWIVKSVSMMDDENFSKGIVVMELY